MLARHSFRHEPSGFGSKTQQKCVMYFWEASILAGSHGPCPCKYSLRGLLDFMMKDFTVILGFIYTCSTAWSNHFDWAELCLFYSYYWLFYFFVLNANIISGQFLLFSCFTQKKDFFYPSELFSLLWSFCLSLKNTSDSYMACFCLPLTGFLCLVSCISVEVSSLVTGAGIPAYAHGIWLVGLDQNWL